jgi:hypothetical protein
MAVTVKRGDRRPYYIATLEQPLGTPVPNLNTANSITLYLRRAGAGGEPVLSGSCTVLDNTTAQIRYIWAVGDTDLPPGDYDAEVEVIWAGEPLSFPTQGFDTVTITDAIHV